MRISTLGTVCVIIVAVLPVSGCGEYAASNKAPSPKRSNGNLITRDITPGWHFVSIDVYLADVLIEGVNPWKFRDEWRSCSEDPITVAHPCYPKQRHLMYVYELALPSGTMKFATGEFSNGVYGFYSPE
jgi:hypothetical protein